MKQLIGVLIMLIIIFSIAYAGNNYLENSTSKLKNILLNLKNYTILNKWEKAKSLDIKINNKWNSLSKIIPILKDQGELHDLEITLTRISVLINQKNKKELLSEIAIARKLLTAIYEQEKLLLENIF